MASNAKTVNCGIITAVEKNHIVMELPMKEFRVLESYMDDKDYCESLCLNYVWSFGKKDRVVREIQTHSTKGS